MTNAPAPAAPTAADLVASDLARHFALIIGGLCEAVAAQAPRNLVASLLLVRLWGRLQRLAARFARLAGRAAAGTLPVRRPRDSRAGCSAPAAGARRGQRWPNGYAWLLRLVPEAASYGSQLQHLLSQPEMVALIAAVPQAGRMFGPLARMLAVQTGTQPPPRPARIRAVVASVPPRVDPPRLDPPAMEEPASGFLPSGVPYWARNAWPGHDFAGRDPPKRRPPALDRSG